MEAIYSKIRDMLKAYYPVLYLTSFEYDRTRQKIVGIINSLKSDNSKQIRLFNWNCVEGLCEMSENGFRYLGEEYDEPEMTLKFILNDKETSKDIFILEDFGNYIEEENIKYYIRTIAERARHTNTHAIIFQKKNYGNKSIPILNIIPRNNSIITKSNKCRRNNLKTS